MRSIYLLPLVLLACGDNHEKEQPPDARPRPDAALDAMVPECDYTEIADATNDDLFGTGTAETTALSFSGTPLVFCGQINTGHFNGTEMNVDVDSYRLTVPAATQGLVYLSAAGASALQSTSVEISGLTTATAVSEVGVLNDTFAVTSATLPPGDYLITVSSYNTAAPAAALDYKVSLILDSATRCPKDTTAVDYPETNDGSTSSGNDVYEVRYSGSPARQFTVLGTDAPETTNVTVAPDASYRITGTSASPASAPVSWMDSYKDRDTYQITMGATTNTLAVRVNWPSTTTDLDFFVFPMGEFNELATGWYNRDMEDEFTTLAVTPGATYEIMVAADDDSTTATTYDLTVCGSTYAVDPAAALPAAGHAIPRRHPVFTRTVRPLSKK